MGKKRGASAAGAMPAAAPPDHVPVGKQTASNKQDSTGSVMAERAQKPIDPRFAAMQTDPRFERFPDKRRIIKFDPRFAAAFDNPDFHSHARVDKRGRKVKSSKSRDDMRKYYRLQNEDGEEPAELDPKPAAVQGRSRKPGKAKHAAVPSGSSQSDSEEGPQQPPSDLEDDAAKRWARLRGVGQASDSSSESDTDSDSTEEAGLEQESEEARAGEAAARWGAGAMAANPAEQIAEGEETRRLAAVDLDWGHVRAVDIFAALRSFLPAGGALRSVTVYPSDYGLQRMKEDASAGPQGIFKPVVEGEQLGKRAAGVERQSFSDSGDEAESETGSEDGSKGACTGSDVDGDASDSALELGFDEEVEDAELDAAATDDTDSEDVDGADEVDQTQLRMYERSKLRYYYAVIECDSVASASRVYAECDGLEFELSACKFDLRFVPDAQSFEGREVRDRAESVAEDYEAPTFQTQALQHTRVKSTWDADDASRKRALGKRVTKDELRDDDFKAYLASDSGDSEPDEAQQERIRALLEGGSGGAHASRAGAKGWGAASESDGSDDEGGGRGMGRPPRSERGMEMQMTFGAGLESLAQRTTTKKQEYDARKADTVWERVERRRREKRAAAKAKGRKNASSDEEYISEPDAPSGSEDGAGGARDPFFQHDDDPFSDPFFQDDAAAQQVGPVKKAAKAKQDRAAAAADRAAAREAADQEAKRRAELELLLMDEDSLRRPAARQPGGAAQPKAKVSKKERLRQKKASKLRERQAGSDDDDLGVQDGGFQANPEDPRFSALYTSDKFGLDPTDPQYRETKFTAEIQARRAAQRLKPAATVTGGKKRQDETAHVEDAATSEPGGTSLQSGGRHMTLDAMVAALKRKAVEGRDSQGARQYGKPKKHRKAQA